MLTALTSVFVGTGATAYAAEVCTHEYDEHIIEATCTEMGYTEYVCSLCGESYKDNYTEAKGHTYTETETQATCTEKGYITYVCDDCGYTYTSVNADETGHDFESMIVLKGGIQIREPIETNN